MGVVGRVVWVVSGGCQMGVSGGCQWWVSVVGVSGGVGVQWWVVCRGQGGISERNVGLFCGLRVWWWGCFVLCCIDVRYMCAICVMLNVCVLC